MGFLVFIPVLFICMNGTCNVTQSTTHYTREADCKAALTEQRIKLIEMAAQAGQTVTILQGACIAVKEEML